MSDINSANDPLANGMDDGSGDPNDDRTFLMDQAPAKVDDEAVAEKEDDERE